MRPCSSCGRRFPPHDPWVLHGDKCNVEHKAYQLAVRFVGSWPGYGSSWARRYRVFAWAFAIAAVFNTLAIPPLIMALGGSDAYVMASLVRLPLTPLFVALAQRMATTRRKLLDADRKAQAGARRAGAGSPAISGTFESIARAAAGEGARTGSHGSISWSVAPVDTPSGTEAMAFFIRNDGPAYMSVMVSSGSDEFSQGVGAKATVAWVLSGDIDSFCIAVEPLPRPEPEPGSAPIQGWRTARLYWDGGTAAWLCAAVSDSWLRLEATARCLNERGHLAPDWDCTCGFYVVASPDDVMPIIEHTHQWCAVLLEVEAWGRVIEHEDGWRAQHQRVMRVYLPKGYLFPPTALHVMALAHLEGKEYPPKLTALADLRNALGGVEVVMSD